MVNEARRVFANRLLHSLAPLALLVILLAPTNAAGQAATGTVSGTVTDQSGGVIDAARVTMVNLGTGMQREAATGSEGQFVVPLLPPGTYKLAVLRDGFSPAEVNPVVVKGGEQVALQIQMKVESLSEAVVVTAQKRGEERLQEVPIPVTVVNPEALAETGQNRLRDYYASLPGVVLRPIPGTGQSNWLTVRGVPPIGTIPTVGIVIDDVPFGSPAVFSAGHQPVPDIDPGDLARIEVLRGPQGTLYGASGMGGLLNFVTAEPSTDSLSGRVQLGLGGVYNGSEPAYSFRGSVNLPVNDALAIRASAFTRHDPGYIDNPLLGTGGVNEAAVAGGRVSALWKMTDTASVRFFGAI